VLGTALRPGGSGLLGALLGGAGGAVAGQAIDRNNVRCR
jgi:tetrahydromethanopterin S-methyltransferase subunit D